MAAMSRFRLSTMRTMTTIVNRLRESLPQISISSVDYVDSNERFLPLFVACATWLAAASSGGAVSFPMVLLHQLRTEESNSTIHLDLNTASWIGAIEGLAGIPCVLVPMLMQWRGRRFAFITACLLLTVGWIVIYAANDVTALLLGESFHGLGSTSLLAVSMATITEMMPPKTRHILAQVYVIVQMASMVLNGLLTKYVHWRTISVIMCVPAAAAVLIACMWPESHHWLAVKGEFDKCEEAFIWMRGTDKNSMKELHELINAQRERVNRQRNRNKTLFREVLMKFTMRNFNIPLLYTFVLQYLNYWSGSLALVVYSVELINRTTRYEDVAQFGGLMMNATVFIGCVLSTTALSRYFNKKTILLSATSVVVLTMTGNSVVNYLQSVNVIPEKSLIPLYFLIVYMFAFGYGILPICYLLGTELIPVKHRGVGGAITELFTCVLFTASIKLAPYLFIYINVWGTFLLYAINALLCGIIIWRFIPETTGRTLQDLENYFINGKFDQKHETSITEVVTPII